MAADFILSRFDASIAAILAGPPFSVSGWRSIICVPCPSTSTAATARKRNHLCELLSHATQRTTNGPPGIGVGISPIATDAPDVCSAGHLPHRSGDDGVPGATAGGTLLRAFGPPFVDAREGASRSYLSPQWSSAGALLSRGLAGRTRGKEHRDVNASLRRPIRISARPQPAI